MTETDKKSSVEEPTPPLPVKDEEDKVSKKLEVKDEEENDSNDGKDDVETVKIAKDSEDSTADPTPDNSEEQPPKPPRPTSPHSQAQATLEEAFPTIDKSIIRAVLIASQYKLDPAFEALLAMTDPDYKPDETVLPTEEEQAAHPQPDPEQIAKDEALARKLAAEYNRSARTQAQAQQFPPPPVSRTSTSGSGEYTSSSRVRQSTSSGYSGRYDEPRPLESERSFFDDDLPEIKANLEKGFNETKAKVSSWMSNFRKKIDGEDGQPGIFGALGGTGNSPRSSYDNRRTSGEYYDDYSRSQQQQPQPQSQRPARYNSNGGRRVYDRDPNEISDDFQGVSLRDEVDAPPKPPRPSQELTSSSTTTTSAKETETPSEPPKQPNRPRAVSALGDDDPEEITKSFAPPPLSATAKLSSSSTTSATAKWEPLKSVAPEPESDKDPFFIGDSDEDEDEDEPTK